MLAALLLASTAMAVELPAGTEIQIRLKTKVSTQTSKPQDAVEAVVIAPVMLGAQYAIPAGAIVRGTIEEATQSAKPDERSVLAFSFTELEIDGVKAKIETQLAGVDNAREKLDDHGQIDGILASETITGKIDSGINKIAEKYSGLAGVLGVAKKVVLQPAEGDVTYDAGVEMTLRLTAPLTWNGPVGRGPAGKLQPMPNRAALLALVRREPFQTMADKPAKPSDVTNLMLIGRAEQVKQVFAAAGWTSAQALNGWAKFQTLRALAEDRGYNEAPVSTLFLDGKPPDIVFEKLNNTFARRHHLRVWLRPATFQGKSVWSIAATHDVGINFSEENRTFIHRIDSEIDREREKVVNDLIFTGQVRAIERFDRPAIPQHAQNATGDNLETDGKIVVLLLGETAR
jgi:hypothetical protein